MYSASPNFGWRRGGWRLYVEVVSGKGGGVK
jgi:hypothetical protein